MRFNKILAFAFAALMLVFVGCVVWHAIQRSALEAEVADHQTDLDIALGRINKQKSERAKAMLQIPGASIARDCLVPVVKESAIWKDRRDELKGDATTIKAAAQEAEDAMKRAEGELADAVDLAAIYAARAEKQLHERDHAVTRLAGARIARDLLLPPERASADRLASWRQRRQELIGDSRTIRTAAQNAQSAAEEAETKMEAARIRLETVINAAEQKP